MIEHALSWAQRGIPVFPVHGVSRDGCTCGQADCGSPGKHPRTQRGVHDATTDQGAILAWWRRWPDASIGGAIGGAGLWVLDLDGRTGIDTFAGWLRRESVTLPPTLRIRTGGGGLHLWWTLPITGRKIRNRVRVLPSVDVRATGGYVVLPPSPHRSGRHYSVLLDAPPAQAPDALVDLVAPPPPPPPPPVHPRAWYPDGGRAQRLCDPSERLALATRLGASGGTDFARGIRCPRCGQCSVWYAIRPERWHGAACSHRRTCGWSGSLTELQ